MTDASDSLKSPVAPIEEPHSRLERYFSPAITVSGVALLFCAAFTLGEFLVAPAYLAAAVVGIVALLVTARYAETALLAFILFRPFSRLIPEFNVAGQEIGLDGMFNTFLAGAFLVVLPIRKPLPLLKPYTFFYAAFLILGVVSLTETTDFIFGARQMFRFFTYFLLFLIAYTASSENFVPRLINCMVFVAAVLCVMGAIDLLARLAELGWRGYLTSISGSGALAARINGFQDFPFTFANQLMLAMPAVFWKAKTARDPVSKLLLYGLLFGCVFGVIASGARSAFVALAVALVVLFVAQQWYGYLLASIVFFMAVGFGTGIFQARLNDFLQPGHEVSWTSLDERQEAWNFIDKAILERPIRGHGVGSIEIFIGTHPLKANARAVGAHCDYRKFAFGMGIPGGIAFVGLWLAPIIMAWRRRNSDTLSGFLCAATAATGAAWMTIALVDEIMQSFLVMSVWWTFAGAALGLAERDRKNQTPRAKST